MNLFVVDCTYVFLFAKGSSVERGKKQQEGEKVRERDEMKSTPSNLIRSIRMSIQISQYHSDAANRYYIKYVTFAFLMSD